MNAAAFSNLVLVGAGGFIGAVARYLPGGLVMHAVGPGRFPAGTWSR